MEQYQQQITPEATQATAPEELHPVAAAFGGDIGAALEKSGTEVADRVQTLSLHMARMNYYRNQAQQADVVDNAKMQLMTQIHGDSSNPNATVKVPLDPKTGGLATAVAGAIGAAIGDSEDVNSVERPLGVLNWKGHDASDALPYLDQQYKNISDNAMAELKNMGVRTYTQAKRELDNFWVSQRDTVNAHEWSETNRAQIATFMKGMQVDADAAVTSQNPMALGKLIDSIDDRNSKLQDSQYGEDRTDPQWGLNKDLLDIKFKGMALNNSMTANLKSTGGDPTQFQSTLDRLHDDGKINDTVYDNASEHLDRTSKAVIRQNQRAAKVQDINTTLNYVGQVINGKLDFNNPNVVNEIRANSPTAGAAIDNYTLNKSVSVKPDDEAIANSVDELYKTGSKEQIAKFNVGLMQKFPNGIPQDVVNTMMADGIDRASRSADLEKEQQSPDAVQTRINGGMQALQRWNKMQGSQDGQSYVDYMKNIKNKMAPMDAYNDAIRNSLIRKNPEVATIDPEKMPNQIVSSSYGLTNVSPNQSDAEANYHVKDGMIQPKGTQAQVKFSEGQKAYNSKTKETAIFTGGKWQIIKQ